jgi:hypothetical protein
MSALTITESLAELKLIDNKIDTKDQFIQQHLVRSKERIDPLESEGGSPAAIKSTLQAIVDLQKRKVDIRTKISAANRSTVLEVNGVSRTVEEWLVWRREVYPKHYELLTKMARMIHQTREMGTKPQRLQAAQVVTGEDIISHYPEKELMEQIEAVRETYDKLDGLLSLKNAQIQIDV